ncbi:MAG: acyl-CoA dehydratase activase-related protein [Tannerella sp.]|jgi:predicted CoA-substrate-specific enzyme activase|nr:acyl-CoA dehydratase activase-related protein [Tannerella sp.]
MNTKNYKIGIDAGSTTIKFVVLNENDEFAYKSYRRHKADIKQSFEDELRRIGRAFPDANFSIAVTGSAGMGISERTGIPFVQEVVASVELVRKHYPAVRTLLDLGGEDAKMVFFSENGHPDIRMNGSCAGGTGAFIDQMASLLNIPVERLGEEAARHEKIYPVASRCGVFAKTDIQNLISRNVPVADIAASTLHAVALQSITSLAHGCDVTAPVLCVGGPLTFIPALREAFCKLLNMQPGDWLLPENSEYFPACGAALGYTNEAHSSQNDLRPYPISCLIAETSGHDRETSEHVEKNGFSYLDYSASLNSLIEKNKTVEITNNEPRPLERMNEGSLPPLFKNAREYAEWKNDRNIRHLKFKPLERGSGNALDVFLGIDSGSTTTKIVVTDAERNVVYQYYAGNEGNSLQKVMEGLAGFYGQAAERDVEVRVLASAVTGYGEDLIRSALNVDYGIVETMAHLSGAQFVDPQASFVLDIGGQDMKSLFIREGVISNIELNEACSSGCGSFLQNFASTMHLNLNDFSQKACLAQRPADLGSRCTVFMNSKVKQSLREGAGIDDIAGGLAYSVVKNCLFKVLKISRLNELGEHIVVQGGAFRNDAVCRALELLSGKPVGSTDCPELMGAFGAALFAMRQYERNGAQHASAAFTYEKAVAAVDSARKSELHCKGCTNACSIVKFSFDNGNVCYAGNKCEKIFSGSARSKTKCFNAFDRKNEILFGQNASPRNGIRIGIPRVLNMYENFPFWQRLFDGCGFETVLSPESAFPLYRKGVGSVMSDNICFPAKLVHGHVLSLVEQRVDRIFYPLVPKEEKEFEHASNSYNCPVVSGYPDVVRSAIDPEGRFGIPLDTPVITFHDVRALRNACRRYFSGLNVDEKTFEAAFDAALQTREETRRRLIDFQKEILNSALKSDRLTFVVAGRPYHADPLIHQKTGQILSGMGVDVLTDDVFREEAETGYGRLNFVSQWSYPNRVVQAALQVARLPRNIQMIQLNSFGCGPDSFLTDEATALLKAAGKNLTVIRIDEIASPGSVRLRLRSLVESLRAAEAKHALHVREYTGYSATFEKRDRQKTILVPWFADFISPFVPAIGKLGGYRVVNLPPPGRPSAETGLKYGHNEVCYPSTLVLGDAINALQSGAYDPSDVAVLITQTGGQCRATNYISQIKQGLIRAGFGDTPVIALATGPVFQNSQSGFRLPLLRLANIVLHAVAFGDALWQMYTAIAVREREKGAAKRLFDSYISNGVKAAERNRSGDLLQLLKRAVADFNRIPVSDGHFTKIGLIGEIYVKYNAFAQAHIGEWLRERKMEVMTPPVLDFLLQYFVNSRVNGENGLKRNSLLMQLFNPVLWKLISRRTGRMDAIMKDFRFYHPSESVFAKADYASDILHLSNQFGEGWLLPAEIAQYARQGVRRVVCIQPFGCIANHVVAKGIEKCLKKFYPDIDLLYLDIDSGIAEVNLQNRLHFMVG